MRERGEVKHLTYLVKRLEYIPKFKKKTKWKDKHNQVIFLEKV
jgi:hypothetical protein